VKLIAPSPGKDPRVRAGRLGGVGPRRWAWGLGGAVMLAIATVAFLREPLADRFWPQTRAQALHAQAADALAQGRLSAVDGSGARELFEAELAIDPDRAEARSGLARVAARALVQAVDALREDDFASAHRFLRLARELSVPQAHADTVADALRRREAAVAGLEQLVARADQARERGRLDGDGSAALPLYARVLSLQPDHGAALRGREDALAELLGDGREALRQGRLRAAAEAVAVARAYDAGHVDLPDTEARFTEEVEGVRRDAERSLARGRLQRAEARYRSLLELAPDDAIARRGLERIAARHAARATRLAADFEFAAAQREFDAARRAAPGAVAVREAEQRLSQARQASARLAATTPPRVDEQRLRRLLAEAAAAEARGDLVLPPGESAFDKLRAARALAPQSTAVREASARLLPMAEACFERELRGNHLVRAGACLDARRTLGAGDAALQGARRRLAQRWLAVGDERLVAGEIDAAAAALSAARNHDPALPAVAEFAERLRTATASGR
jgi:hypothetical protein